MKTIDLQVQGMTCSSCVASVTRVLERVPGVTGVDVNLALGRARVTTADVGAPAVTSLKAALDAAGYPAAAVAAVAGATSPDHAHAGGGCGHGTGPRKQGGCCGG